MFKLRRRRARAPAASFDVSASMADSEPATEQPQKRPRTAAAEKARAAEDNSSPLTAKAAARQRERESLARAQKQQQEALQQQQKEAFRQQAALAEAAAEEDEEYETPEAVVNNAAVAAAEDMRVAMEMLAGLRTEADNLHEKAMAAAAKRDEAARAAIRRLTDQVNKLRERSRLFEEALISRAKEVPSSDEDGDEEADGEENGQDADHKEEEKEEESASGTDADDEKDAEGQEQQQSNGEDEQQPQQEARTAPHTPAAARAAVCIKKSPALSHVPVLTAAAPERATIALPPQSPLTLTDAQKAAAAATAHSREVRIAQLERVVKFYELLTSVTVQPAADPESELKSPLFRCTLVNGSSSGGERRAVEFCVLFGDSTVEYTPTKIDVPPGFVLSDEFTEAIEFDGAQAPIFVSKLIDELYSTVEAAPPPAQDE